MQAYILKEYNREDISLKELNLSFINGFEHFLRTVRGCCTNTIWLYMIGVKHIISVARNEGLLVVNPFAGYMISPEQVDRGFLSEEELQLLMKTPMKINPMSLCVIYLFLRHLRDWPIPILKI